MDTQIVSTPIGDFKGRTFAWNGENVDLACAAISSGFTTVPLSNDNEVVPKELLEAINTLQCGTSVITQTGIPTVNEFRRIAQAVAENGSIVRLALKEYSYDDVDHGVHLLSSFSLALPSFAGPHSKIHTLNVSYQANHFGDFFMPLEELDRTFSENVANFIRQQPSLKTLHIQYSAADHFNLVLEALGGNTTLTSLNISECLLTEETTAMFVNLLPQMSSLKTLIMDSSFFFYPTNGTALLEFEDSYRRFCEILGINTTIQNLSLKYAKLGCNNLALLGTALASNETLVSLNLGSTGVEDGCATNGGLFESIAANTSIKNLYLAGNNLTSAGLMSLLEHTLTRPTGLDKLDVSSNRRVVIENKDRAFTTIMDMIDIQTLTLKTLTLYDDYGHRFNKVDKDAAATISAKIALVWKTRAKAAKHIKKAWQICRWDPSFKICEKVQMRNLEDEIGPAGMASLFTETQMLFCL